MVNLISFAHVTINVGPCVNIGASSCFGPWSILSVTLVHLPRGRISLSFCLSRSCVSFILRHGFCSVLIEFLLKTIR